MSSRPSQSLVDRAVDSILAVTPAPPGVCLIVSHAGTISSSSRGAAQRFDDDGPLLEPVPMGAEVATDLGSITKVMATCAGLIELVSLGEVDLSWRLGHVLPWTAGLPAGEAVLVDLLEHRAGLWEWWPLYLETQDRDAAITAAAARPLRYPPQHGRHYSDLGFILLGAVLAAVAGDDLAATVQRLVLTPMGLASTRFGAPSADARSVAASSRGDRIEREMIASGMPYPVAGDPAGFSRWRERVLVGEVNDGNAFHALGSCSGHAGLFSTATDLAHFGDGLLAGLRGERGDAVAAATRRFLTPGREPGQGLGFRRWELAHGAAWGHTGFPGCALAVLPHLQATVALVTNRLHTDGEPAGTEAMWHTALAAAERQLTEQELHPWT